MNKDIFDSDFSNEDDSQELVNKLYKNQTEVKYSIKNVKWFVSEADFNYLFQKAGIYY